MLQYALLHLFGYQLSIDDLKNFRVSILCAPKIIENIVLILPPL